MPTNYWLDLSPGLTQVLASEEATYLYGLARIGEEQPSGWQFYLGDALGSVRQLVGVSNGVGAGMAYEPFGDELASTGVANSVYGFTGEWADSYIKLIYLRSRYYAPESGRFITKDVWTGDYTSPMSYNKWLYVVNNPIIYIDPSGQFKCDPMPKCKDWLIHSLVQLDVSAGPFGDIVFGAFERLDNSRGNDTLKVSFITGTDQKPGPGISLITNWILLPMAYMNDSLPPPKWRISIFAHEVVHQIQTVGERSSTWGEAQAYIFQGKILEELGVSSPTFINEIMDKAYDLSNSDFTTLDRKKLEEVKGILVNNSKDLTRVIYAGEPVLPWEILDRCGPHWR